MERYVYLQEKDEWKSAEVTKKVDPKCNPASITATTPNKLWGEKLHPWITIK